MHVAIAGEEREDFFILEKNRVEERLISVLKSFSPFINTMHRSTGIEVSLPMFGYWLYY